MKDLLLPIAALTLGLVTLLAVVLFSPRCGEAETSIHAGNVLLAGCER